MGLETVHDTLFDGFLHMAAVTLCVSHDKSDDVARDAGQHALVPGVSQVEAVGDLPELFRHERDVMLELLLNVLHTGEELYGFPQVGLLPDGVRPFL